MPKHSPSSVLLIEDDAQLSDVVGALLEASEFHVHHADTGEEALCNIKTRSFDCIMLDLNLPDEDGLVILRKIKKMVSTPVIICSARGEVDDRIAGLEFGANDYLPKPYSSKELVLRIKNLITQQAPEVVHAENPQFAHYELDEEKKALFCKNTERFITLTLTEFFILARLSKHPGRVYSRSELIDCTAGINGPEHERAIDVTMSRLRKKIEEHPGQPEIIKTAVGFGYYLEKDA